LKLQGVRRLRRLAVLVALTILVAGASLGILSTFGPNHERAQISPGSYSGPSVAPDKSGSPSFGLTGSPNNTQPSTVLLTPNPGSQAPAKNSPNQASGNNQTNTGGSQIEFFSNLTMQVPSPISALSQTSAMVYSLGG